MTPDMNLDMEELNKRRVERHLRRQQMNAKKRRKRTIGMIAASLLLIALGTGVFFLGRKEEQEEPEKEQVTHSGEVAG